MYVCMYMYFKMCILCKICNICVCVYIYIYTYVYIHVKLDLENCVLNCGAFLPKKKDVCTALFSVWHIVTHNNC